MIISYKFSKTDGQKQQETRTALPCPASMSSSGGSLIVATRAFIAFHICHHITVNAFGPCECLLGRF
jgi:hypothetical protein